MGQVCDTDGFCERSVEDHIHPWRRIAADRSLSPDTQPLKECPAGARPHFSNSAATALMRLREYFGSPALMEFPVLNELLPASTCAGTRLRRMGTLSSSFFFSKRSLSTASAMKALATDFLASAGSGCSTARNLPNCMTWLTWKMFCSIAPAMGASTPVALASAAGSISLGGTSRSSL